MVQALIANTMHQNGIGGLPDILLHTECGVILEQDQGYSAPSWWVCPAKSSSSRSRSAPPLPSTTRCAFLHFCSEKRPKLKQENPSFSVGALAKQLSAVWKLMTPEQKKPYDGMAEKDKQRWGLEGPGAGCCAVLWLGLFVPADHRHGTQSVFTD